MATQLTKFRIFAAISLSTIYLPGVISKSIWSDDYPSLIDPNGVQIHASRDGRPLYGLALQLVFNSVNQVSNLWLIRLIALMGLLLLNDLVIKILSGSKPNLRLTVSSVGAFSIAGFQINVHWATAFPFCWVAYFALLGFTFLVKDRKKDKFLGVLLLIASSLSYPILTFFVLPVVFLLTFEGENNGSSLKKNSLLAAFGIGISGLLSLVINFISINVRGLGLNDRVSIVSLSELPDQILWFLTRPFVLAFRGYSIDSPGLIEAFASFVLVNLLIIAGIAIKFKTFSKVLRIYLLLIFFTLSSMAPLFFPNQQQVDVRYVTVGSWLISYVLISSVFFILGKMSWGKHRLNHGFVSVTLIILFFLSINVRYFSVIQPIYKKTSIFISSELAACSDKRILSGIYVIPRETDWQSNQYIGLLSQITDLASTWVPLNAVRVGVDDIPELRNSKISISWGDKNSSGCLVDLNRFQTDDN